jgi:transglutaminase-like putative cysteine protease
VGVAWDGSAFVWHAWAEVRSAEGWIPVDPSFGQLPARGPRFTIGRWGAGDDAAREVAGARILACWGSARVASE